MTYFKTSQMASWRNRNRGRTKPREDNNHKTLSTKTIYGVNLTRGQDSFFTLNYNLVET